MFVISKSIIYFQVSERCIIVISFIYSLRSLKKLLSFKDTVKEDKAGKVSPLISP